MLVLPIRGLKPGPLQFSPDGSLLAFAPADLMVVEAATGRTLWTAAPKPGDHGDNVAFSADGRRVVRGVPVSTIYEAATGAEVGPLPEAEWPGRAGWPLPLGFPAARSPCGRWAVLTVMGAFRVEATGVAVSFAASG